MTTALSIYRIRLKLDPRVLTDVPCTITGATPQLWRGVDAQVECGFYMGGTIVDSFTNIATVYLQIHRLRSGPALVQKSLAVGSLTACTDPNWTTGTGQHAIFTLPAADTQFDLTGSQQDALTFWLVVHAVTTGGARITLGGSQLKVVEDGAQNDLDVVPMSAPTWRIKNGDLQLWNPDTGLYHPFGPRGPADALQSAWGPGEA